MVRFRRLTTVLFVAGALVATTAPLRQVEDASATEPATGPGFETTVDSVAIDLATVTTTRPGAESAVEREVGGEEQVESFTMIGATYTSGATEPGRVRVLIDGEWSRWFRLFDTEVDADHGPDDSTGERSLPASDPVWVGDGEGYELSLPGDATDVTVHLVREEATSDGAAPDAGPEATPEAAEAGSWSPPNVRPRSAWGAAPYRGSVDTANRLQRAVVHHTVNGNGYSAVQVPSMIRSIQAYHQNSRGWDDIGYNFVIDRFGTVWEGRAGSLFQPVIGAHASNANTGSVGVAYLGDGTNTRLNGTALTALGRFLGWKLPLHGPRASRHNILGHRNVGQTACPGNALYNQLGAIRNKAIALAPPRGPFFDVPNHQRRATWLRWGRNSKVISPIQDGTFRPDVRVTKADSIFWLWRSAGRPSSNTGHGYSDIPNNAYYRDAVRWARKKGIVTATSDGRFRPNQVVTRHQYVVALWRFVGQPNPSTPNGYDDVAGSIPDRVAVDWADEYNLVPGRTYGRNAKLTRDQSVQLLYRLRRFGDVPKRHFAYGGITWAKYHVIATGFAGNKFRPNAAVARIHAVNWLWKTMDRPTQPPPPDDPFTDDNESAGYAAALDWAAHAEWVDGHNGQATVFAPAAQLRRGVAMRWLWNMAGQKPAGQDHSFTDVPPDLDDAVDWASRYRLIQGFEDGTFRPDASITRAQFLRTMFRLANRSNAWDPSVTPPRTAQF